MNKKEKELMKRLSEMMKESGYILDDAKSQLDFNIYSVMFFDKIIEMDYTIPYEKF
jgi:hypothetical protein